MEASSLPQSIRKTPRQARSLFTADILLDAAIEVLLAEGPQRLTTTRVAERAGVSIGSLYQYYENRLALLFAAHQRHVRRVSGAVLAACEQRQVKLSTMVRSVVAAFVNAKTANVKEAQALYLVTPELTAAGLVTPEALKVRHAIAVMLRMPVDVQFADPELAASMFLSAMIGPMRVALERRSCVSTLRSIGDQTVTLCESYLYCVASRHPLCGNSRRAA